MTGIANIGKIEPGVEGRSARLAGPAVVIRADASGADQVAGGIKAQVAVKVGAVGGSVVENPIQHQLHAMRFGGSRQRLEIGQRAKIRVDHQVIGGIVLVIGRRPEDGVQIQDADSQVIEITLLDFLGDAGQIAAVEILAILARTVVAVALGIARIADGEVPVLVRVIGTTRIGEIRALDRATGGIVEETPFSRVVGGLSIAEAIREDLIDDAALHPLWRLEIRIVDGQLVGAAVGLVLIAGHLPVTAAVEPGVIVTVEGSAAAILQAENII